MFRCRPLPRVYKAVNDAEQGWVRVLPLSSWYNTKIPPACRSAATDRLPSPPFRGRGVGGEGVCTRAAPRPAPPGLGGGGWGGGGSAPVQRLAPSPPAPLPRNGGEGRRT